MIKDSDKKLFDIVLVWKLDRFARNRYDSARYKTQLKRNGVKLVSATEVISAGPEGIILESVLEGYAEYYSADLSEKVVRGMTENALKGIYNGGTILFGYMIDETRHYQPDPLLAPYVEQTFQKYADGATMTDLRDWLKAHNIKNSMGGTQYRIIQLEEAELHSAPAGRYLSRRLGNALLAVVRFQLMQNIIGTLHDAFRHTCHLCHMNTERMFAAATFQFAQKNLFIIYLLHRYIVILDALERFLHLVQLMIMSGKQRTCLGFRMLVNMLHNSPSNGNTIIASGLPR